jgi:hypothetical protein
VLDRRRVRGRVDDDRGRAALPERVCVSSLCPASVPADGFQIVQGTVMVTELGQPLGDELIEGLVAHTR